MVWLAQPHERCPIQLLQTLAQFLHRLSIFVLDSFRFMRCIEQRQSPGRFGVLHGVQTIGAPTRLRLA